MTILKNRFVEVVCFLFIVLFVYAAVSKLIDHQKFVVQLGQSPMLTRYAQWVSILLPVTEILLAVLLTLNRSRLFALYASFGLMVMFSSYIVIILNFSAFVPCSCGGILEKMSWRQHLIFNYSFIALGAAGILLYSPSKMTSSAISSLKIMRQGIC